MKPVSSAMENMERIDKLTVNVNLVATYKMLADLSHLSLEMKNGETILDAFFGVLKMLPTMKPHWLDKEGQPQIYVHVYLNGDDAMTLPEGMDTRLHDGDSLDFIPPVAGG